MFQTTGPDFFTRYLKRAGLARYAQRLSARSFLDPTQRHREVVCPDAKLEIAHRLSWLPQFRDADGTGGPQRGGAAAACAGRRNTAEADQSRIRGALLRGAQLNMFVALRARFLDRGT